MYFKLQNLTMDLGDTPVENIFLNDYMPQADGNFVKIYLLGYKFAKESRGLKAFDFGIIADLLGLIESDLLRAWDYWEKAGIIKKEYNEDGSFNIIFLNLKQLYIENIYSASKEEKVADRNEILDDKNIANLLSVADYYMRRPLSIAQKQNIASWRDTYNMPTDLIEEAFWYSTEVMKKDSVDYVEAVVRNWAKDNIRSKEDIEKSYKEYDDNRYRLMKVKNRIGLSYKAFNQVDFDKVNSWFNDLGFNMDIVMAACDRCINTNNPNIGYVDSILRGWKEKGITEVEDIDKLDKTARIPKTKFHNFKEQSDNYSKEDLDELAKKKRDAFFKKLR